jgi:hypothetical protein
MLYALGRRSQVANTTKVKDAILVTDYAYAFFKGFP